jgi:hypothetical protein
VFDEAEAILVPLAADPHRRQRSGPASALLERARARQRGLVDISEPEADAQAPAPAPGRTR